MAIRTGGHVTDSLKATHAKSQATPVLSANGANRIVLSHGRYRNALDSVAKQVHRSRCPP